MITDKREKFVDLAEKRVSKALKDLHLVGNLSNKANYSYSDKDVQQIHKALLKAVEEVKLRFDRNGAESDTNFKLKT